MQVNLIALACAAASILVAGCSGGPECTAEPESSWMSQAEMKNRVVAQGYKVKEFKVSGSCYEIYGWNREGQRVEVYFDPVSGDVVKSEVE